MSPRAARNLPAIQPILPELQLTPFDHRDWLFEPKYNRFRGLLHITRTGAAFTWKRGLQFKRLDQLAGAIAITEAFGGIDLGDADAVRAAS